MPDRDTTRINERIRVPEVRLIDENGEQVGILPTDQALRMAQERDLDLVEVAAQSRPPVCRILDYSKYKYEQAQKQKAARKHQTTIVLREIKFRPKIAQHDYDTKKGHVERFLLHKDKVKVTIMFRGREVTHPERGQMILERIAEELEEIAQVDQRPQQDGRNMTMMLSPSKAVIAGQIDADSWKARGTGSAMLDAPDPEAEGITVEGPGEERSEVVPTPVAPPRLSRKEKAELKAEAQAAAATEESTEVDAEPVADAAPAVTEVEAAPAAEPDVEPVAPEPEAAPEAEAPEPEPEPEPEPAPEPKKPKKVGPAPVSKAEAALKRKPKPLMNLGTGARVPGINAEEEEAEEETDAKKPAAKKKAPTKAEAAAAVAGAKKKAPTKAEAAAAVAGAKKPAAKKPAAKKPAAAKVAASESTEDES